MPSRSTISKGLSEAQTIAWEKACHLARLSRPDAIEEALRLFCAAQDVEWPGTAGHGGTRPTTDELCRLMAVFDDTFGVDQPVPDVVRDEVLNYAVERGYVERAITPGGHKGRFARATEAGIVWHYNNR
jgi:hypothetical protein